MFFLLLLVCLARAEQVLGQQQQQKGGNRLILKNKNDPSDPCKGHVRIYHNSEWGYAGDEGWTKATEEVVCRSARCGNPVSCLTEDERITTGGKIWLNEMNCVGNESHPWDCSAPGWGVSVYRKDTVKQITCSNRISISLEGFRCAGTVRYSIDGRPPGYFCADNWGRNEADRLCKSLNCGQSKDILQQQWMVPNGFKQAEKVMIQCSGIESEVDHLWQCVTQESTTCERAAFVECEDHERLQLSGDASNACSGTLQKEDNGKWEPHNISTSSDQWCKQMNCGSKGVHNQTAGGTQLTCPDKVSVQLTNDRLAATNCYGRVSVRVNNSVHPVCANDWDAKDGEVVCRELRCGKVIATEAQSTANAGIMDNVRCSGNESSLWHCRAKRGSRPLQCSSSAHVVCQKSLDVRLTDGPGRCAGRVQIQYKGGWKEVSSKGWTDNNSNSVCRQLQCGDKRTVGEDEKFSQGSGVFFPKLINCLTGTSRISDCISDTSVDSQRDEQAVGIICEEHKVVFLHGHGHGCSGLVGIEQGSRTYWLSGSNETWNQDVASLVCQQRHCGSLVNFTAVSNAAMKKDVWKKSLNCSSKHNSLFECEENDAAPDYNATVASVTCLGAITYELTNGCWGNVNVTVDGKSGGVCADAWTQTQSLMLCKDLGCGDRVLTPNNRGAGIPVILNSLHATTQTTSLSQCNIVKNDASGNSCKKGPAYVVCSGSVKPRLSDPRDKCSGNVEVSYEGRWLPVCKDALNDSKTQSTICKELTCGEAVRIIDYFGPSPTQGGVISELKCPNSNKDLKTCSVSATGQPCHPAGLQCSMWRKVTLSDGCGGGVTVHSRDGVSRGSVTDWRSSAGSNLCSDLDCGNVAPKSLPRNSCAGEPTSNVSREQHDLIDCPGKPTVTVSGDCGGDVRISGVEVCSAGWKDDYSHIVCHEQRCSNAVAGLSEGKVATPGAEYVHVVCEDHHHKLSQCKRYKGTCVGKLVSVSCVNSVKFKTSEKCGGQIQVKYQDDRWEEVCPVQSSDLLRKLCHLISCGDHSVSIAHSKQPAAKQPTLRTTLDFSEGHWDVRHSVRVRACQDNKPAEIYCDGYVPKIEVRTRDPVPIVPILLGVGVVLILVIVVSVFAQIKIKKARKSKAIAARMLSQQDMEFESGEFADIKEDEMENFNHGRFGPEADVTVENGRGSASSLAYDDIDEATESRPLTVAGAAGREDQSAGKFRTDGVTYEVEDPQESYDDIDASPGFTRAKADVHHGPRPPPAGPAAESQPPRQEEDYLVPGQDG